MNLRITDNNWSVTFDQEVNSNADKYLLGTYSNSFVIVAVYPTGVPDSWSQGGSVGQAISINNTLAYGTKKELSLRILNLLEFNSVSGNSYQLYYFPLDRLGTVAVKVWEYQGTTQNVTNEQLVAAIERDAVLTVDLSNIETKLNAICAYFGINNNPQQPTAEETLFFLFN